MLIDIISVDTTWGHATFRDADGKIRAIDLGKLADPEAVAAAPLKVTAVTDHPSHLATYRVLRYDGEVRVCGMAPAVVPEHSVGLWDRGVPLDTPFKDVPVIRSPSSGRE